MSVVEPEIRDPDSCFDKDIVHIVCCDSDGRLSLCGIDTSNVAWDEDGPVVCIECEVKDVNDICPKFGVCPDA